MLTDEILEKIKEIYKLADEIQQKDKFKRIHINLYQQRRYIPGFRLNVEVYFCENDKLNYLLEKEARNIKEIEQIIQKLKEMKKEVIQSANENNF